MLHKVQLRQRAPLVRWVGHARSPEALRGAAEAAEHAGVELGRDQDEDVVAEEGQRHGAQQRQREQPGPPAPPWRPLAFSPHCAGSGQGARRGR